jgi:hypothetical protein
LLGGSTKARTEGQRIPATALESLLVRRIRNWLSDPAAILQLVSHAASDAATQKRLIERAKAIAAGEIDSLHTFMRSSIVRVQVYLDRIDITLDQDGAREHLDEATTKTEPNEKTQFEANRQVTTLSSRPVSSASARRCGSSSGMDRSPQLLTPVLCAFLSAPTQSAISFSRIEA